MTAPLPNLGRLTWALLGIWGMIAAASLIGAAMAPYLLINRPLWLLLLSPLSRHLLLLYPLLDPELYYGLGFLRRYAVALLIFVIAFRLSDRALTWIKAHWPNLGAQLQRLLVVFKRIGPLLVLLPSVTMWFVAGLTRMQPLLFAALAAAGTLATLAAVHVMANVFSAPLDALLNLIREHVFEATLACLALVTVSQLPRLTTWLLRR